MKITEPTIHSSPPFDVSTGLDITWTSARSTDLSSFKQLSSNSTTISTKLEEIPVQSTQSIISQTRDTPYNYTSVIAVTGGVIALFLAILVMQMCLKMRLNKQKTRKMNSIKANITAEPDDLYHEINDMNVAVNDQSYLDVTEQSRKESELRHLYTAKCNSYQKIDDSPKYLEQSVAIQHTNNSSTDSSNSSDGSAAPYLKPKKQSIRHSYIEVTDLDIHSTPQNESVVDTRTLDRPQNRSSSQYDDVINPCTTNEFRDITPHGDVDDTDPDAPYLDVVNYGQHSTYLDVVHSINKK